MSYKVGIIDSGVGGLSVLKEVQKLCPFAHYYYYCDHKHAPYGPLSQEDLFPIVKLGVERCLENQCKMVILACNTATASVIDELRREYLDTVFVGVEPYVNILNKEKNLKSVALIVTELTLKTSRFQGLVKRCDPNGQVEVYGLPKLATIIEKCFQSSSVEAYLEEIRLELAPLEKRGISNLILGCTHYALLSKTIEKMLKVKTIDSALGVANRVKELIPKSFHGALLGERFTIYNSKTKIEESVALADLDQWPK